VPANSDESVAAGGGQANPKEKAALEKFVAKAGVMFSGKEVATAWVTHYGKELSQQGEDVRLAPRHMRQRQHFASLPSVTGALAEVASGSPSAGGQRTIEFSHRAHYNRMHRALHIAIIVLLAACDANFEKAVDLITGRETNVVVLLDKPTQLGPVPRTLASREQPMKVLGEWSGLCLSLRGAVPLQDSKVMDQIFAEAMAKAKVKVELTLSNGTRVGLRQPLQAWSLQGKVVDRHELSACARAPCGVKLPVGLQVSKVDISSDLPLSVQGIYWQSETDLPKPPPDPKNVASSSSPKASSSCTS
jgi:hypothetical protein